MRARRAGAAGRLGSPPVRSRPGLSVPPSHPSPSRSKPRPQGPTQTTTRRLACTILFPACSPCAARAVRNNVQGACSPVNWGSARDGVLLADSERREENRAMEADDAAPSTQTRAFKRRGGGGIGSILSCATDGASPAAATKLSAPQGGRQSSLAPWAPTLQGTWHAPGLGSCQA